MSDVDRCKPRVVLARRENAGIRVTLLWAQDSNTVAVRVRDDTTHDRFELRIEPGANPMDVYVHPFAYAARQRVDHRSTELPGAA
jgi:hypothetical protein